MKKIFLLISFILAMGCSNAQQSFPQKTADSLFVAAVRSERKGDTVKAIENYTRAGDYYFTKIDLNDLSDTLTLRKFFQCQKLTAFQKSRSKTSYQPSLLEFLQILDTCRLDRKNVEKLLLAVSHAHYLSFQFQKSYEISRKILFEIVKKDSVNDGKFSPVVLIYSKSGIFIGKYDSSIRYAEQIYNSTSDKILKLKILDILLICNMRNGNYDLGETYGNIAIELLNEKVSTDTILICSILNSIAGIQVHKGDFEKGYKIFQQEFKYLEHKKNQNNIQLGVLYHNIGSIFARTGNYSLALNYLMKSLTIEKNIGNNNLLISCYRKIGYIYSLLKDEKNELKYLKLALEIGNTYLGEKNSETIVCAMDLCEYYVIKKKYSKALNQFYYVEPLIKELWGDESHDYGNILDYMAQIKMGLHEYDSALFYFDKELKIFTNLQRSKYVLLNELLNRRAQCFQHLKQYDKALVTYQKAIIANMMVAEENINDSLEIPLLKLISDKITMSEILFNKADCILEIAQTAKENKPVLKKIALEHLVASDSLLSDLQKNALYEKDKLDLGEKKYQTDKKLISTAVDLFFTTRDSSYLFTAYKNVSSCKMNVLSDLLKDKNDLLNSDVPDSLKNLEHKLKVDINYLNNKLSSISDSAQILKTRNDLVTKHEQYEGLLVSLEKNYPKYYDLVHSRKTFNAPDLQKYLPGSMAVLDYFLADTALYIFLVTRSRIKLYSVRIGKSFPKEADQFAISVKTFDEELYLKLAHKMYLKLIHPVSRDLKGISRLKIIPSQELFNLPFEAILTQPVNGIVPEYESLSYLIRKYEISYHYSSTLLLDQYRKKSFSSAKTLLAMAPVFGNSSYNTTGPAQKRSIEADNKSFPELEYSATEVNDIVNYLRPVGWTTKSLIGVTATEKAFKQYSFRYNVIHLSTHSFVNDEEPLMSGIVFHKNPGEKTDGILYSWEIYNQKLNAGLAVLSSCESGTGKMYKGEGMISLTRSFLYAGCNNVIFSLWKVFDMPTAMLMKNFYQGMKDNKSYSASLREAKLKIINTKGMGFPINWSGFVQVGIN